jgi:hypothetical protein
MKTKAILLPALVFLCLNASAQIKLPVTNNDLRTNLEKVIADFPNHFVHLKSEVKANNPQTVEYASNLDFKGAEENIITEFAGKKPIYSWQAVILTAEDYNETVKKYKWLCNQLKAMTLRFDGYSFGLDGKYEQPDESRKFTTTTYTLTPASVAHPKLKIEVGMHYYFPEWKVTLTVYQKEREDQERGETEEN